MTIGAEPVLAERRTQHSVREGMLLLWCHELSSALRGLVHSPRYTLPALLSLALGIGAATAVFSVFSALVLRPLPFAREAELVRMSTAREGGGGDPERIAFPFVQDFRALSDVFAAIASSRQLGGRMDTPDGAHLCSLTVTSRDFFDVLGVQPELGRAYTALGPAPDPADVVVLRHGFWLEAFAGAPIVGQTVRVNDEPKLVVSEASTNWGRAFSETC